MHSKERVIIVQIELEKQRNSFVSFNPINEFKELVVSSGAVIEESISTKQSKPSSGTFITKGKAEEIKKVVKLKEIELVIFNHSLSPSQERNLESFLNARVLDRTGLILDIFAQRAFSHTGKLQVELAQLKHLSTRLIRGWSHLERQKGGIGLRAGPGEKQLETDRRLISQRIKTINKRLSKVHKQKSLNRNNRKKKRNKLISVIGYTNSGKTTLFNLLTGDNQYVADQLFATLDPITRKNKISKLGQIMFSDTVGFISDLPTQLIEAFKATLDELKSSDLLLHVVDISDPDYLFKRDQVENILVDLGASDILQIRVNNKIDKLKNTNISNKGQPQKGEVWISAKDKVGISVLKDSLHNYLNQSIFECWISIESSLGKIRSELYSLDKVIEERTTPSGLIQLRVNVGEDELKNLLSKKGITILKQNNFVTKVAV